MRTSRGSWFTARRTNRETRRGRLIVCLIRGTPIRFAPAPDGRAEAVPACGPRDRRLAAHQGGLIVTQTETDIQAVWLEYRERPTVELRNRLVERYLSLVKYNAERIWARLPDGVELDDLI